jgi:hypothetical protein
MVRTEEVSLRRPQATTRRMVTFRLPEDAIAYYEGEAKATGRDKVAVVLEAIYLDRHLGRRLASMRNELVHAAETMGLSLDYDFPEVIAKLVEAGLKTIAPIDPKK